MDEHPMGRCMIMFQMEADSSFDSSEVDTLAMGDPTACSFLLILSASRPQQNQFNVSAFHGGKV